MWPGFDPDHSRALATIRQLVALRYQTPTKEWPLVFVHEHQLLLVLREWPDGTLTAYATPEHTESSLDPDHPSTT